MAGQGARPRRKMLLDDAIDFTRLAAGAALRSAGGGKRWRWRELHAGVGRQDDGWLLEARREAELASGKVLRTAAVGHMDRAV